MFEGMVDDRRIIAIWLFLALGALMSYFAFFVMGIGIMAGQSFNIKVSAGMFVLGIICFFVAGHYQIQRNENIRHKGGKK